MAHVPAYPPYSQPIVSREGRVSTPWHRFFLSLVSTVGGVVGLPSGSVPIDALAAIASPRLLGRGSPGTGPVEQLTIGAGLALTGTELAATASGISGLGYWTPITNGDPVSPEILFDATGDCVVGWVPTP
jgi:hypothetical protein